MRGAAEVDVGEEEMDSSRSGGRMAVSISNPASASPTLMFITISAPPALVGSVEYEKEELWWARWASLADLRLAMRL